MAHDEEQERHSAVKQKPLTLSKTPIFGWWRPAWNLSFEARVGILAWVRIVCALEQHGCLEMRRIRELVKRGRSHDAMRGFQHP